MDIRQHTEWQEVLDRLKATADDLAKTSRQGRYRLYKWRASYIVETIADEQTILLRTDLKLAINAAKEKGLDLREIILDL